MFSVDVQGDDLEEFLSELDSLRDFRPDFAGLREPVTQAVQEEHRRARLAGLDKQGNPLAPLAASTLKHRDGTGPPLAPHETASRVVTNFIVDVEPTPYGVRVSAGYAGIPWLKFHAEGAGRLPVRDVMGIQPTAEARVDQLVNQEADRQVIAAMNRRPQGLFGRVRSFFGGK